MKLAVTPFSAASIDILNDAGADIFIIGNEQHANRLVHSFSMEEITEINSTIKTLNKEIYIALNLIAHNDDLPKVIEFLQFVMELNVDGIIFGDLGVYNLAKNLKMENLLIYNPETLNTNYYDSLFWENKGIKGITISKEITLKEIDEISQKTNINVSITGHGHLNMFHSRRPLIGNFFKYTNDKDENYSENRDFKLIEEIRDEAYPIFQDSHGTHIFRDKALESYKEINFLENILDVFIIDGIFKDTDYLVKTIKNYNEILNSKNHEEKAKKISDDYKLDHDSGFLYKKTVYVKY